MKLFATKQQITSNISAIMSFQILFYIRFQRTNPGEAQQMAKDRITRAILEYFMTEDYEKVDFELNKELEIESL